MKRGFSAVELVISMGIATMLMSALFMIYNQVTKNMGRVHRFVSTDIQLLALNRRFSQDVAGLTAVWYTQADLEKEKKDKEQKSENSQDEKKQAPYFYSVNKDGHLDFLTFITNNPLQSYGASQDRFVRIVYKVQPDKTDKNLFRLLRKEIKQPTENIDEQALQQGKFYELVSGIKSIELTYYLIDRKELQKQSQQQGEEKNSVQQGSQASINRSESAKPIIRSVKQWNLADITADAKKREKEQGAEQDEDFGGAAVPKFIEIKVIFAATAQSLEQSYIMSFIVPSSVDAMPKNIMKAKSSKGRDGGQSAPGPSLGDNKNRDGLSH